MLFDRRGLLWLVSAVRYISLLRKMPDRFNIQWLHACMYMGFISAFLGKVAPVAERLRALFLNHSYHLTAVSGVGSDPAMATCETSQVLLAGVSGVFSQCSPVFTPPTDRPVSYEL